MQVDTLFLSVSFGQMLGENIEIFRIYFKEQDQVKIKTTEFLEKQIVIKLFKILLSLKFQCYKCLDERWTFKWSSLYFNIVPTK